MSKAKDYIKTLDCPECGARVTIPNFWILGIEGVFLCPECKHKFTISYKIAAIIVAIGFVVGMVILQLLTYLLGVSVFMILLLPFATIPFITVFILRKSFLIMKEKRKLKQKNN